MNTNDDRFEDYRRERNKRRMDQGPLRHLGQNASVLRELEAREQQEVRNQQLTREVHEFFEEATRTAADIVSKVAHDQEELHEEHVCQEMSDFLHDAIARAQELVTMLQLKMGSGNEAQREMAANMLNLVGQKLDEFRHEGTAQLQDKHIGLDPADVADAERRQHEARIEPPAAAEEPPEAPQAHDDHLAAELVAEEAAGDATGPGGTDAPAGANAFFDRLRNDPEKLREMLKLMVKSGQMTKDEAVAVYKGTARAR